MIRYYFMPETYMLNGRLRTGKYVPNIRAAGVEYALIPYGANPVFLVRCANINTTQHNALAAQADVIVVPENIDSQIGGALATVQTRLEQMDIPAEWVTSSMTYRVVLRRVAKLFQFVQAHYSIHNENLSLGAVNLNDPLSTIAPALRQRLQTTATWKGVDTSDITLTNTIRDLLAAITARSAEIIRLGNDASEVL